MKKLLAVLLLLLMIVLLFAFSADENANYKFIVPKGWPKPAYNFNKNKITADGFKLGKALFNDPVLSKDNSVSCASCHLQFTAFTHADHNLSHGIYGLKGTRNSIALFNMAWSTSFMWDGGVKDLIEQPINPITNPVEMGSKMEDVVAKLNASSAYRQAFYKVYGDSAITAKLLLRSLAQFTVMIESYNSKYDSVMRHEPNVTFTSSEQNGYTIFKRNCSSCHTEPLFTNNSFQNNGLPVDTALRDYGRMKVTKKHGDSLKFRVPSLRNVAASAPYMHDGRFPRLKDVIDHYASGICHGPTLATQLSERFELTSQDKKDLLAFLNTLTDKYFLYDYRFRDRMP